MDRRGFLSGLAGILAAGVAPAAIGSGVLMPIRKLWTPLADYEEGTWVPTFVDESFSQGAEGVYRRIGKVVVMVEFKVIVKSEEEARAMVAQYK